MERAWQQSPQFVATELEHLDGQQLRARMRNLIYELVDHPHHHYVRLYGQFGQGKQGRALLA